MSGGMNIGTLGGEDVMHEEFSYEAKTYNKNAKTYKGKDWVGETMLYSCDKHLSESDLAVMLVTSMNFSPLIMLRWKWWKLILEKAISRNVIFESIYFKEATKFRGDTYMRQAEKNCPDAKIPITVVHTTGHRHERDIVLVRNIYWNSLLEKLFDK
jgi:hypothetical protein